MQTPRKHHFVPQFWTKNWLGPDGKAQRFTNPHGNIIVSERKATVAIGWSEKLYNFPTHVEQTLDFETLLFRHIDQRASDLFKKLCVESNPTLSTSETETLAVFLLTLLHRSPAGITAMRALSRIMYEEVRAELRNSYHEVRAKNDPQTVEEYEKLKGPEAYLDHFSNIFRTVVFSEKIAQFLANLHWKRITFKVPDRRLLLSDDPLIRTNGLAGPEGHVAFPLTPYIAIIGCNDSDFFETIFSLNQRELIGRMNEQTVQSARHFVVDIDNSQERFIRNRFGRIPRPTLSEASLRDYEEI
ncbi:DUF4238 domain-containing protein [Altererythrobacter sp. GH1-8]|uniref:DUF4238 domain-containing protein n=1 Tax=Altererythrobacter sp. GH1-8 TaxID=3349333 RepID=UPI00374D4A1C